MNTSTPKVSPLRQRMIEDMRIRKLEPKTQSGYIRAVRNFTIWFGRSPDRANAEDLRLFQLHLVDKGVSPITINAMQSGLRFFFDITLKRGGHALDRRHAQHQVSGCLVSGLWRRPSRQRGHWPQGQ
jgi:integrase/recombinase XerD